MSVSAHTVGDGKKYLPAAQKEARALLTVAGVSSNPISERCSVTVNHCCVQVSKLTEEQEGREQGEREGKRRIPSCSAHETSAKSSTEAVKPHKPLPRLKPRLGSARLRAGRTARTSQTNCGR